MMKWPVERQILAGFALALALLVVMGALVYDSSRTLVRSHAAVQRAQQALTNLEAVRSLVHRVEADQRLYFLTGNEADLRPLETTRAEIDRVRAQLAPLAAGDDRLRALLPALEQSIAERARLLDGALARYRTGGIEDAREWVASNPGRAEVQRIEEIIERMRAAVYARLNATENAARADAARGLGLVALLLLVSLLSVSALYLRIRREIRERQRPQDGLARRAEDLRQSETRLRTVLNTVIDAIIVIDECGIIESFNPAAERTFGFRAAEVIGRNVSVLMPSPDRERHDGYLARYLAGGEPRIIGIGREVTARHKDGGLFPIDLAVSEMQVGDRRMFTGIVRDITERKRAEDQRARLIEELQSANEELQNFAYIVSHDLKAPLRAIGSLVDWLNADYHDALDAEGREHLRLLKNRVVRMDGLIEGILQYSRAGRVTEKPAPVNTQAAVRNAIDLLAPPAHVHVAVDGPLPAVMAEPTRVQQVFQNLLSNAIKYMDKPEGRVHVGCRARDGAWEFSVADNGPGIDARHHEKIFQLFQTLAPRDRVESTGVGLALVKRIVELYGGRVRLESAPGRGSTFYFTLPRVPAHDRSKERRVS